MPMLKIGKVCSDLKISLILLPEMNTTLKGGFSGH
jgi:hypothetical protein